MEHPLPHDLLLAALQELRSIVYALLRALDFTPDEATPVIGRLTEIDRRIVLDERLSQTGLQIGTLHNSRLKQHSAGRGGSRACALRKSVA